MKSPLILAILGIILGIGTTAGVIWMNKDKIFLPPVKVVEKGEKQPTPSSAPRDWTLRATEINLLSQSLKDERAALDQRKTDLDDEETRIVGERKELAKVRAEIDVMRQEVSDKIPVLETAEKQNIKTLAKTYSTMKPADAVAILREMDDNNIVKILSLMKADVVGALFQQMATTKDMDGTLAARAAHLSDQLRLLHGEVAPTAPTQP